MRTSFLIDVQLIFSGLGFPRTYTAPREHLDHPLIPDRSPAELLDISIFESLMSDPMTHLVMLRDNVTELEVRGVISRARARRSLEDFCEKEKTAALPVSLHGDSFGPRLGEHNRTAADRRAIENGENEGMALA
jgi:hypothetical protein